MAKNRNLISNSFYNFKLNGRPSIFIGLYIILGSLFIKTTITGFQTDSSPFGFLTVDFFEGFIFIITLLVFFFSILAIFFGSRRYARRIGNKVWNKNSKKSLWLLLLSIFILYSILFSLLRLGQETFIISTFLMCYGFLFILFNFSKSKELYYLAMTCFMLGLLPLLYPYYGFNALFILGVAHLVFGLTGKNN
ncbi:MAG: hypothetical protein HWD85_09965 [Flavobacteriaceae bacterium]|nr:hypothetical protein [Flavobacteriaceae bacterium]